MLTPMELWIRNHLIVIVAVAAIAVTVVFLISGPVRKQGSGNEQGQTGTSPGTDPTDTVVERERGPLPGPLGFVFPNELPELTFPCASLRVPERVQAEKAALIDATNAQNRSNGTLLGRVTLPLEIERGPKTQNAVALTVDTGTQGPLGIAEILDIAKHYDVPVTFFVTGCWTLENPELAQRIVAEGHTLAHHTLTHVSLSDAGEETLLRELDETTRIIEETTGVTPVLFRKPLYAGGEAITEAVGERGMVSVQGWPDLGDTTGWHEDVNAEGVLSRIESRTAPGAIWVFHNLSPADLNAFERVVRFHLEAGYDLVSVEELI